jgi:hypothetical protein
MLGELRVLQLPECWLQVGMHLEVLRPAVCDTGFLSFPLSFKQMLRWFPRSQLLLPAFHAALPI